jgi:hypothetical protein
MKPVLFETGDIEVFKELFCIVLETNKTHKENVFVISPYQNDLKDFYNFINKRQKEYNWYMFSYNGNKYDWIIVNYMIKHKTLLLSLSTIEITKKIYTLNTEIHSCKNLYISTLSKYMYEYPFQSIDLMCFWTISTIKNKKLSLKFFAISMDMNVEETSIPWVKDNLTKEECDSIVSYCKNDVKVSIALTDKLKDNINSRFAVRKEYRTAKKDFKCLSWDDVKIGYEALLIDISKESNVLVKDLKTLKTLHDSVRLDDIIIPEIVFNSPKTGKMWYQKAKTTKAGESNIITCFDNFTDMLEHLKTLEVRGTKELSIRVYHKGVIHDIKSGGIHSYHDKEFRIRKEGYLYEDIDVSSYYPTLGVEQNFVPHHLIKYKLADILKKNKDERVADKLAGRTAQANIKKLKLNGGFFGRNTNYLFRNT